MMEVTLILPHQIYARHEQVMKICAEGLEGHFTLLPAHVDYVSVLVPGILQLKTVENDFFLAVDHGVLVKNQSNVRISSRNIIAGENITELTAVVSRELKEIDEMERKARSTLLGLEYNALRRFAMMGKE